MQFRAIFFGGLTAMAVDHDPPDDQIPVLEGMHCRMPVSSDGALLEHRSGCSLETLPAKTDANNSHNLRWVGINDGSTVRTAAT